MLGFVRIIGLALWSLVLVLVFFTTETVADELGWTEMVRDLVKAGPAAMFDSSYDAWVLGTFWFLTGATATAWAELAFRKWLDRRKAENWVHFTIEIEGRTQPLVSNRIGLDTLSMIDGQVLGNIYDSDPRLSPFVVSIILQFDCEIDEPCPYIFSDRKVIWREVKAGKHYLMLELDLLSRDALACGVVVRPLAWSKGYKADAALKWHDSTTVSKEQIMRETRSERRSLRSLLGTAKGRLRRILPG